MPVAVTEKVALEAGVTLEPAITVTLGMGVGGGSLVYSGIHLRAPERASYP